MLARRLPTILPAMTLAEAIDTTRIHRVAGRIGACTALATTRPCRAPLPHQLGCGPHRRWAHPHAGRGVDTSTP